MDRIQFGEMFGCPFSKPLRFEIPEIVFSIKHGKAPFQLLRNKLMAAEHFTLRNVDLSYLSRPVVDIVENAPMKAEIALGAPVKRKHSLMDLARNKTKSDFDKLALETLGVLGVLMTPRIYKNISSGIHIRV